MQLKPWPSSTLSAWGINTRPTAKRLQPLLTESKASYIDIKEINDHASCFLSLSLAAANSLPGCLTPTPPPPSAVHLDVYQILWSGSCPRCFPLGLHSLGSWCCPGNPAQEWPPVLPFSSAAKMAAFIKHQFKREGRPSRAHSW